MYLKHVLQSPDADPSGGGLDQVDDLTQDLADLDAPDADADDNQDDGDSDEPEDGDEKVKKGGKDKEDDEEDDEEKDDEKDEKEDEDEEDDEKKSSEPNLSPSFKDIKAKYPDLFKDFPNLRSAFFLAPKFLEVFPDVEEASIASQKAQEYDVLESTLVGQGDPRTILATIAENQPQALKKIAGSFGEAMREVSQEGYQALTEPIIQELVFFASQHGQKIGDKNLVLAARHIANFVWANGGQVPDQLPSRTKKNEPSEAEVQLQEEREATEKREFSRALTEIETSATTELNQILNHKLDGLTPFEKKAIVKEAKQTIDSVLLKDKAFQQTLKGLWRRAQESGWDDGSKSRIRRAWLDRAKAVAPGVRNRLKTEALTARNPGKGREEVQQG
jgi:hypothetical protein